MEVCLETSMIPIKKKMTEIRRGKKSQVFHNYYLNCEQDEEIFALYGQDTVVFWDNDRGIYRAYFYSANPEELAQLLRQVPEGALIDYLTYTKGELEEVFESADWEQLFEMHRMVTVKLTPEEKAALLKKKKLFDETLYKKENVYTAREEECDIIYDKLLENFDPRESHLCTKEELLGYIRNRWVSVYYEEGKFLGFHIFLVEHNRFYGYQIWNKAGTDGYYSLIKNSDLLFEEAVKNIPKEKIPPSYCWVNLKNRASMRLVEFWGQRFNGLYDFVYERRSPDGSVIDYGHDEEEEQ